MLERKFLVPWTTKQTFTGILLTLVPWIGLSLFVSLANTGSSPANHALTPSVDLVNAIVTFVLSAVIEGAFLIAPLYYARRSQRNDTRSMVELLGIRRFKISQTLLLILGCMVFIILVNYGYSAVIQALGLHLQTNDQVVLARGKTEPFTTYATLLVAVTVAPFCEELFFRSFVFMGFLNGMSLLWATIFSALVFAAAHADPASFPVLFFIGLALALVRWRTHSFWPGFCLHALNNAISAILVILTLQGFVK